MSYCTREQVFAFISDCWEKHRIIGIEEIKRGLDINSWAEERNLSEHIESLQNLGFIRLRRHRSGYVRFELVTDNPVELVRLCQDTKK